VSKAARGNTPTSNDTGAYRGIAPSSFVGNATPLIAAEGRAPILVVRPCSLTGLSYFMTSRGYTSFEGAVGGVRTAGA
jgi:hypothetical protein